ncbi:hypothetical protein [Salegentibacter mishustinae]|uniref:hypothetical protein n=1 Tax=Salegentibacter mishustinae TaxID=270918 RepID=UPI0024927C14|nr:hypothetical protein [Salegentibacter mishustinae]
MTYASFRNLFLLPLFFIVFSGQAQNKITNEKELKEKYTEYFSLNRETVYLHLNKSTFLPKENIWFAAYVVNQLQGLPSLETTNLNIELYNSQGEHLETKTLFINGGKGTGFFELEPGKYRPGNYFIKASTKYMNNFKEDLSFVANFKIEGQNESNKIKANFDLHILPEGGHLLADVQNTLGIKLINSAGDGVKFKDAKIIGNDNQTITTFKSNRFGMGKANFTPESGKSYKLQLTTSNGDVINRNIEKAEETGLSLTNNFLKDKLIISLKTNEKTLSKIEKKDFLIAIHKNGEMRQYKFQFPKGKTIAPIDISTDSLFAGVNTITVFNEDFQPLLERLIFNYSKIKRVNVNAKQVTKARDSLKIQLNSKLDNIKSNTLSISVLPGNTSAYGTQQTILSEFLLEPYVKGEVENSAYYFRKKTDKRRRNYDLDLLLLTQGWSKYSWNNIFNETPKELYPAEKGFTINGTVNDKKVSQDQLVFLQSDNSSLFEILQLDDSKSFKAKNLYLLDSAAVNIGLAKKNNRIKKPAMYATVLPQKNASELDKFFFRKEFENSGPKPGISNESIDSFIKKSEALDTVVVKASSKTSKEIAQKMNPMGKTEMISEETGFTFFTSYLKMRGFQVKRNVGSGELIILSQRMGRAYPPIIFMDGVRLQNYNFLGQLHLSEIESVYINKTGGGIMGPTGIGGVIKIKTGENYTNKDSEATYNDSTFEFITENGFASDKEFYAPKYRSYSNNLFEDYGVIHWIGYTFLNQDGNTSFKILDTQTSEIKIFVEGMTENGALISEEINLETP